jgi:hypothetical protein
MTKCVRFLCLMVLTLPGCATRPPLTIALSELGTASKADVHSTNLRFIRSTTVTGLGPEEIVGSLSVDPDPPWFPYGDLLASPFAKKNLPDSLTLRITNFCSHLIETTFGGNEAKIEDIVAIRDNIGELTILAAGKVTLEVKKAALEAAKASFVPETKPQDRAALFQRLKTVYPDLQFNEEDSADNAAATKAIDVALKGTREEIEAIRVELEKKRKAVQAALQTPGIIVTEWSKSESKSGRLQAVGVGYQGSKEEDQQGYLILGNPRTTTLVTGRDFAVRMRAADSDPPVRFADSFNRRHTYMTFFQLSAKHLAWLETKHGTSRAAIQADVSKIIATLTQSGAGIPSSFAKNLDNFKVTIQAEIEKAYALSNTGLLSKPANKLFVFRFADEENFERSLYNEFKRANGYRPIYSARATLETYIADHMKEYRYVPQMYSKVDKNKPEECSASPLPPETWQTRQDELDKYNPEKK